MLTICPKTFPTGCRKPTLNFPTPNNSRTRTKCSHTWTSSGGRQGLLRSLSSRHKGLQQDGIPCPHRSLPPPSCLPSSPRSPWRTCRRRHNLRPTPCKARLNLSSISRRRLHHPNLKRFLSLSLRHKNLNHPPLQSSRQGLFC
jgi:hypothetical protein